MKKILSLLLVLCLLSSFFATVVPVQSGQSRIYTPYDPAILGPEFREKDLPIDTSPNIMSGESSPSSDLVFLENKSWLVLDDYYGVYRFREYGLVAVGDFTEIWVAHNLSYPVGDPRPTPVITSSQVSYLLAEFENNIYPTLTSYFAEPDFLDGSFSLLEWWGYEPEGYYYNEDGRIVILISNIMDENYYDPTYPIYIAGFYSPTFEIYFDRNIISIDAYDWANRVGPSAARPYLYESIFAHEFQHLIHDDWQPADDLFMNEGCSEFTRLICGYGPDYGRYNHFFATPDNSLTEWGDQGDINILADYGAVALWTIYLEDHYPGILRQFFLSGVGGVEGLNLALSSYRTNFDAVFHNWRLANLLRTSLIGGGIYNYFSINLNAPGVSQVKMNQIKYQYVPWTYGSSFGTTKTALGYDTGIKEIATYGTDYVKFTDWNMRGTIHFDGNDYATLSTGWELIGDTWYSGSGVDLIDTSIVGEGYVNPANPVLAFDTYYDIEEYWDFGFVQISTDGGASWTSLSNEYTTLLHDENALPAIIENLPGLTGSSDDWIQMEFDLSDYAGSFVQIRFRYMTDWATTEEGWYVSNVQLSGSPMALTKLQAPVNFQVTVVQAVYIFGRTILIPVDMLVNPNTETGRTYSIATKPGYTILVVSPIMTSGTADYKFMVVPSAR